MVEDASALRQPRLPIRGFLPKALPTHRHGHRLLGPSRHFTQKGRRDWRVKQRRRGGADADDFEGRAVAAQCAEVHAREERPIVEGRVDGKGGVVPRQVLCLVHFAILIVAKSAATCGISRRHAEAKTRHAERHRETLNDQLLPRFLRSDLGCCRQEREACIGVSEAFSGFATQGAHRQLPRKRSPLFYEGHSNNCSFRPQPFLDFWRQVDTDAAAVGSHMLQCNLCKIRVGSILGQGWKDVAQGGVPTRAEDACINK
mmetsp:Transcript_18851/g.47614  ORF Transcript_18851/g.47614 Transcript_18851/m.47614 type:complete len:258 (+) Transcript_18851:390-1163(+)